MTDHVSGWDPEKPDIPIRGADDPDERTQYLDHLFYDTEAPDLLRVLALLAQEVGMLRDAVERLK